MKKKLNTCGKLYGLSMLSAVSCIVFLLSIAGCTRTVYVPLESHTTSTLDREHIAARVDTVIDRDTVTLTVSVAGDTVRQEVTRWRERIRQIADTVIIQRTDTLCKEIPVTIERNAGSGTTLLRKAVCLGIGCVLAFVAIRVLLQYILRRIRRQ